jgi:hypothetical protein
MLVGEPRINWWSYSDHGAMICIENSEVLGILLKLSDLY